MKTMHLYLEALKREGAYVKRSCQIERRNDDHLFSSETLWYKFPEVERLPADSDAESYLLATVMQAMLEGRRIVVHGAISRQLLMNLTEYRDAWCCWLPQTYHAVDFEVEEITEENARQPGAICAFSGGVDATFSVWRHTQNQNGYRTQVIRLCAMVHGFDIPLQDEEIFASAFHQATATLQSIGIPLLPLYTNLRQVIQMNWEHLFVAALVSALQNFKEVAGTCIVGSSRPYEALVFPWGSTAITDPLLSSSSFAVLHDGATHSRTRKVAAIQDWQEGCNNLRVCWEGELKDRNCGRCEKCLRTILNFRANNLVAPNCFPQMALANDYINQGVRQVQLRNAAVRAEWKQILEIAIHNGVQEDWVGILASTLRRQASLRKIKAFKDVILPQGSIQKKLLGGLLAFPRQIRKLSPI